MPRHIKYEGRVYTVPDDATPEEIDELVTGTPPPPKTRTGEAVAGIGRGGRSLAEFPKYLAEATARGGGVGPIPAMAKDFAKQFWEAHKAKETVRKQGEGLAGQTLTMFENAPWPIGPMTRQAEKGGPHMFSPESIGATTQLATEMEGPKAAKPLAKAGKNVVETAKRSGVTPAERAMTGEEKGMAHWNKAVRGQKPEMFVSHMPRLAGRGYLTAIEKTYAPRTFTEGHAALRDFANQLAGEYEGSEGIKAAVGQHPLATIASQPIADAIRAQITGGLKKFNPDMAKALEAEAKTYDGKSMTVQEAYEHLKELNAPYNRSGGASPQSRVAAIRMSASKTANQIASDSLRHEFYGKMGELGVPGIDEFQKDYGSLTSAASTVWKNIPRGEMVGKGPGLMGAAARHPVITASAIISGGLTHSAGFALIPFLEWAYERSQTPHSQFGKAMKQFGKMGVEAPERPKGGIKEYESGRAPSQIPPLLPPGPLFQLRVGPASIMPAIRQQEVDYGHVTPTEPGNIQWYGRPKVDLSGQDLGEGEVAKPGEYGTVYSESRNEDGLEVLYPRIYEGKLHDSDEAWQHYKQTGEHMGKFATADEANYFADKYHNEAQAGMYDKMPKGPKALPIRDPATGKMMKGKGAPKFGPGAAHIGNPAFTRGAQAVPSHDVGSDIPAEMRPPGPMSSAHQQESALEEARRRGMPREQSTPIQQAMPGRGAAMPKSMLDITTLPPEIQDIIKQYQK